MNIENNVPQVPAQPVNQTFVQSGKNRSFGVVILTILLLITMVSFGGYVYYNEVRYNTEGENNIQPSSSVPTTAPSTTLPTARTLPTTQKVSLDYLSEDPNRGDLISLEVPIGTKLTKTEEFNLKSQTLDLPDCSQMEIFIGHGGEEPLAYDIEMLTPILTKNYDTLYRLTNIDRILYANIQMTGICLETVDSTVEAPCGDSSIFGVTIICRSSNSDYSQCDEVVKSISGIDKY